MSDRKIKVVFGVNDFLVGGMQNQFAEQIKFFDRERFEIVLITLFNFPGMPTLYDELSPDLEVHRLAFKGIGDVRSWKQLYRLLKELEPEVVVSSLFYANFVFRILKPFIGYVSIPREHNTYTDKQWWQRFSDYLLASISYRIVAVSTTVADFTSKQERIPRRKFAVIHNGIDAMEAEKELGKLSKESLKNELGFQANEKIFLNIGRLVPQKNHKLLIDGFAIFHRSFPDHQLAIVGDSPLREELEAYARAKNIGGAIRFFGFRRDVWNFYKICDAFVSTSTIEGFSNNYLEALASGIPLVATKTAGTDELLENGKNGFFILEATPECVATTMTTFEHADMSALRSNAVESVKRFDIRTTVEKYERLFTEAVHRT